VLPFLACAVFGGVLLLALFVAGAAGGDASHVDGAGDPGGGSMDQSGAQAAASPGAPVDGSHPLAALVGLRPLAAGLTFFGLAGAALRGRGAEWATAVPAATGAGALAAVLTAALLRSLLRFESDGAVRLDDAPGREAVVYVAIPAGGAGKVQLALQGRLVESLATAADGLAYPTGARVLVVDRAPDGGLLVAADPAAPPGRGAPPPYRSTPP
jgi:hypothetical protein